VVQDELAEAWRQLDSKKAVKAQADEMHLKATAKHRAAEEDFTSKNASKMRLEQEELTARLEYKAKAHAQVGFYPGPP
jgi:hypothetical protein